MFYTRFNTFLRVIISNDIDIFQDDELMNKEQIFIRCDRTNSTYYKDIKGRICVLCKWGIGQYCAPSICEKHRIHFNECVEIKSR